MRLFASLLLVLSVALTAVFAPGAEAMRFRQSVGEAPQVRAPEIRGSGVTEIRAKRHCASQTALSQGSPACQLDKSMPDAAFAPAARARSIAYAPETAPALRHRGPAPEHGPPRHLS
jgi:hypothetical protein